MCEWKMTGYWGWTWRCCNCQNLNPNYKCTICQKQICREIDSEKRKILIISSARGGTMYASTFLKKLGLRVGHECIEEEGMVSCYALPELSGPHITSIGKYAWIEHSNFENIFHLVRNPLKTIRSCTQMKSRLSKEGLEKLTENLFDPHETKSDLEFAMKYWLYSNQTCEQITKKNICLEKFAHYAAFLAFLCGKKISNNTCLSLYKALPQTINQSIIELPKIFWKTLYEENKDLAEKIKELTKNYGYPTKD